MGFENLERYPPHPDQPVQRGTIGVATHRETQQRPLAPEPQAAATSVASSGANQTKSGSAGSVDDESCFRLGGFPSAACNGVYRVAAGDGDFVNDAGYHCFFGRKIGDWVLKDAFEPECQSATAIAGWGGVDKPVMGTSSWRWWASGWEDVLVTVSSGNVSTEPPQQASAQPAAAQQSAKAPVDFSLLSAEIVMLVLHHSRLKRSRGAMACVCKGWRDAARERQRRPSIMAGAVMNESSFKTWTARRMEAAPHSFG